MPTCRALLQVKREREHELEHDEAQQQARKVPRAVAQGADPRPAVALDLNEPARAPEEEEEEQTRAQQAQAAAAEWYRQLQCLQMRAAMQKAAVSAGARRRRLEILRAKGACPLVSSRARRVG